MPTTTSPKSGSRVDAILELIDGALAEYDASVNTPAPAEDDQFPLMAA
ncbi:MAG: hypothetical protein ABWZ15_05925 [Acidimicrobiia bacterium]|jgi:hypothetical protein